MEQEIATLAPASGAGIGKLIAQNLFAREGFIDRMGDAIWDALGAERRVWDKEANNGRGAWEVEPDNRSRLQAFFGIVAHMEGEPVKRIIHQHLGASGKPVDPVDALQESPALRAAVERTLAKATHRDKSPARHMRAKQADAVLEVD